MIFRDQFPDNTWLKNQIKTDFDECRQYYDLDSHGWPTVLINSTKTQTGVTGIEGSFTIFFNNTGKSSLKIGNRSTTIYDTSFAFANKGQTWDIEIPKQIVNDSTVFSFGEILFSEASYYLKQQEQTLLDYPHSTDHNLPDLQFSSLYRDPCFDREFEKIRSALLLPSCYRQLKEETIFNFIGLLFKLLNVETNRKDRLKSVKYATRIEILSRLHKSIEIIHSEYNRNLSLQELAAASHLSKFHFLRTFKEAYGITPLRYIQRIRVNKAIGLLKNSALTVQDIAEAVGFENGNSLTRLLNARTSLPPTGHRTKKSNIG